MPSQLLIETERFSKWTVLLRTVASIYRFGSNCRRNKNGLPIEALKATERQAKLLKCPNKYIDRPLKKEEYEKAENFLWCLAQRDQYSEEINKLREDHPINRKSDLYKLSTFVDETGVLRIDGRTANAIQLNYNTRYPIILPNQHQVTKLIIHDYHCKLNHANRETVVNEIRQKYYVPHLRAAVDRSMKNCQTCNIKKFKLSCPKMATLPNARLAAYAHPFSYVGIDYLGPLDVAVGRRSEKRYVAVFTCLVTRAVHLEVAFTLSTESCIMAIRRFIARRGPPVEIFSDNGTNFVGTSNILK